ncbi:unnamed protein product [Protopolystoma xenopodis]|uniref:Uncharacterized protein n=1 Tax=Protopolystoma xenopodis TaxID=117903 RepID=A0A448WKG7_9PLAT|nr:unnamed protein product [Protopolystoma xenopodis]
MSSAPRKPGFASGDAGCSNISLHLNALDIATDDHITQLLGPPQLATALPTSDVPHRGSLPSLSSMGEDSSEMLHRRHMLHLMNAHLRTRLYGEYNLSPVRTWTQSGLRDSNASNQLSTEPHLLGHCDAPPRGDHSTMRADAVSSVGLDQASSRQRIHRLFSSPDRPGSLDGRSGVGDFNTNALEGESAEPNSQQKEIHGSNTRGTRHSRRLSAPRMLTITGTEGGESGPLPNALSRLRNISAASRTTGSVFSIDQLTGRKLPPPGYLGNLGQDSQRIDSCGDTKRDRRRHKCGEYKMLRAKCIICKPNN